MSDYLSKNLEGLKKDYSKYKVDLSKTEKRLQEHLSQVETELYDKYIGAPIEKANENNLPIKDVVKLRKGGREKLEGDLHDEKIKKTKELGIAKKRKHIFRLEMEINRRKNVESEATSS